MKKLDTHVDPNKIALIQGMLSSPAVKPFYDSWVALGNANASAKLREDAFTLYAQARDMFLGLPPLKIIGVQGSHNKRYSWRNE